MKPRFTSLAATGLTVLALAGAVACNGDKLTDLNTNPNNPVDAGGQFFFTNGARNIVNTFRGVTFDLTATSLFVQHVAKRAYTEEDRYAIRPENVDAIWAVYSGSLEDLNRAAEKGLASKNPGVYGPAITLRSWGFGVITDTWGDVPYSQALKGDKADAIVSPAYDAQKDVYTGILADLKMASDSLAKTGVTNTLKTADPIYAGDVAKWRRFANSLRLRHGMRLSKVDPARAQQEVAAAFAAGVMQSNADNATFAWPGDGTYNNPFNANFRTRDDFRTSRTIVDTLKSLGDPRLTVIAQPTQNDKTIYAGLENGLFEKDANVAGPATSKIGTFFSAVNSPMWYQTYAEVQFLLAEAAVRGWIPGGSAGAKAYYENGITASFAQFGLATAAPAYIASAKAAFNAGGSSAAQLQQIGLQKWIALFGQGSEAWAEWRRTGVPALTSVPQSRIVGGATGIPRRLLYSAADASVNGANVAAAVGRQGADSYMTPVWWDKP
jgi:hypothetical protein